MRRVVVIVAFCLLSIVAPSSADDSAARVDDALAHAAEFLISRQDDDGAWRSGVHGSFRDGPSLTPHVVGTLLALGDRQAEAGRSVARGAAYLRSVKDDGLHFPVYTAAAISRVMVEDRAASEKWIAYVRSRQLNAANGWSRDDPEFGGWGYSPAVPRKPPAGQGRGLMIDSKIGRASCRARVWV